MTFPVVAEPTREQQQEASEKIFAPVREMYGALEEKGRRGVIRSRRTESQAVPRAPPAAPSRARPGYSYFASSACQSAGSWPGMITAWG